jgi:hypothetical protein
VAQNVAENLPATFCHQHVPSLEGIGGTRLQVDEHHDRHDACRRLRVYGQATKE